MNVHCPDELEEKALELPSWMRDLGIPNAQKLAQDEFVNLIKLTVTLTENIVSQNEKERDSLHENKNKKEITITRKIN